jgi:hypothetical protein
MTDHIPDSGSVDCRIGRGNDRNFINFFESAAGYIKGILGNASLWYALPALLPFFSTRMFRLKKGRTASAAGPAEGQ